MSIWTDVSAEGVQRQIAVNIVMVHIFSGFTLWDSIVSLPYEWHLFQGKRGCKWGAYTFYMNTRYLFLCSTITTLVFVDMYAEKFVRSLGTFFQISGHISNGFAYAILALRLLIIWRRDFVALIMILCQLALWASTFAAFPRVIDGFQERNSNIRLISTLLAVSSIMLVCAFSGLVHAYRHHIARLSCRGVFIEDGFLPTISRYSEMLWREGFQYFVVVWCGVLAEAVVRYMHVDQTGLLQFTFEFVRLQYRPALLVQPEAAQAQ
ncbi:hypothetical protein EIP91_008153 [Steccherinum ochraceum]|uniref:Uncharacterized protein n=1 Tax=Steccherinum ochraceum TaxID=92696 RepID=A0A4R0RBG3_9APHY|nr:hypothetical protein EIP91_008153 [Steccherinum ochraceum]